jgi:DNA-binding beta-propeller fold protein YncE
MKILLITLLCVMPVFATEWIIDSVTDEVKSPFGVEVGPDDTLYITEVGRHVISRLDRKTGRLSIVAGTANEKGYAGDGGLATEARLFEPYEVRFDTKGNMYFVEMMNHLIRKVDAEGIISTIAGTGEKGFSGDGGTALKATFNRPHSIALDEKRNHLYVADIGNNRLRRIDLVKGLIETYTGGGTKNPSEGSVENIKWNGPRALFIEGRNLWMALRGGHSVWRIDLDADTHEHIACTGDKGYTGDGGAAKAATMNGPKGIAIGPKGNIYVVDTENQAIRMIDVSTGLMHSIAGYGPTGRGYNGDGMPGLQAKMGRPHGLCVDTTGAVYVGDTENHRIRRIRPVK